MFFVELTEKITGEKFQIATGVIGTIEPTAHGTVVRTTLIVRAADGKMFSGCYQVNETSEEVMGQLRALREKFEEIHQGPQPVEPAHHGDPARRHTQPEG